MLRDAGAAGVGLPGPTRVNHRFAPTVDAHDLRVAGRMGGMNAALRQDAGAPGVLHAQHAGGQDHKRILNYRIPQAINH